MTESFSSRTPQQALAALLEHHAPHSLLLVGARFPALDAFAAAASLTVIATQTTGEPDDALRDPLRFATIAGTRLARMA